MVVTYKKCLNSSINPQKIRPIALDARRAIQDFISAVIMLTINQSKFQKPRRSQETYFSVVEQSRSHSSKSRPGRRTRSRSSSYAQTVAKTDKPVKRIKNGENQKLRSCKRWPLVSFIVFIVVIIGIITAANTKAFDITRLLSRDPRTVMSEVF